MWVHPLLTFSYLGRWLQWKNKTVINRTTRSRHLAGRMGVVVEAVQQEAKAGLRGV